MGALLLLLLSCVPAEAEAPAASTVVAVEPVTPATPAQPAAALAVEGPLAASDPWTLRQRATELGLAWPPPALSLHLDKSTRTLTLRSGEQALKRYRVGLGDPEGDKVRQGDRRTPEGELRIVTRNAASQFHKFLGINYPTAEDADRGQEAGLVSREQADAIRAAHKAGRRPPWETRLGGTVGIHGGGGWADWTLGCVAVTDEEIDELWEVVKIGTPLVVEP